jgi:hypothetical protein
VHRMLYCSAWYNLVWTSFSPGLWPKAELGSTHGIGSLYSIHLQNGTLFRPASARFIIDCSRTPVPLGIDLYGSESMEAGSMEEAGSGHGIPVTTY